MTWVTSAPRLPRMFNPRIVVLSSVLALSACGGAAQRTGAVSIVAASRQLVGDRVQLDLDIANGTDAPAYVYDSERRVSFDEGAQQTTIALQDAPWVDTGSSADCHLHAPTYRALQPLEVAHFSIRLPRAFTRVTFPLSSTGSVSSEIPVEKARALSVELAWSDSPFEPSRLGLCSRELTLEMQSLQRGTATALIK